MSTPAPGYATKRLDIRGINAELDADFARPLPPEAQELPPREPSELGAMSEHGLQLLLKHRLYIEVHIRLVGPSE